MNKKALSTIIFVLSLFYIVFAFTGCDIESDYSKILYHYSMQDCKVNKVEKAQSGKQTYYYVYVDKGGNEYKLQIIDSQIYSTLDNLYRTSKVLDNGQDIKLDLIIMDDKIYGMALSKNRREK